MTFLWRLQLSLRARAANQLTISAEDKVSLAALQNRILIGVGVLCAYSVGSYWYYEKLVPKSEEEVVKVVSPRLHL
jgi:hypothetical protein